MRALLDALDADPGAAIAGAQLLDSGGRPVPCAWRLPDIPWALAAAVFVQDRVAVESTGERVREVGWVQSSAALVRREAAEQVGWLDPDFFVYSDETDFCKRLRDAGWRILFVPAARAVHHNQLSTDAAAMSRRIVEFHRNRDLYFRKHGLRRAPGSPGRRAGRGRTSCAPRRPRCCPGATRAATCSTPARSCSRAAARASGTPPRPATAHLPITCPPAMEHADTAQLAAVGGALGAVLVLLPGGRAARPAPARSASLSWPSWSSRWRGRSAAGSSTG